MKPFIYYKMKAKAILKGNVIKAVAVALFSLFLTAFVNLYTGKIFADNQINSIIASVLTVFFVSNPFAMGMTVFFMNVARGKTAKVGDVFDGYKYFFKLMPYAIIVAIASVLCSYGMDFIADKINEDFFARILYVGLLIIPVFLEFLLSFTMYILYDEKISGIKAVFRSIKLTGKHIIYLMALSFSFLLWVIPILFTLGIASVYLIPYMELTMIAVYDDFKNEKIKSENEEEEMEI